MRSSVAGPVARRKGAGCEGVACEHTLAEQPLHLYGYLWVKPDASTTGGRENMETDSCGKFSAVLTDTVVFKHQKPVKWLFTSKQEKGRILSKSKKHLSLDQVLQEFLTPKLYTRGTKRDGDNELVLASFTYTERSTTTGDLQFVVEHLDEAGLTVLLLHRDKPALSVLQRFIPTKTGYNHMIQSVFTQENCLIRKCVNPNLIADAKLSISQRTITFEAEENDLRLRDVTNKEIRQSIEQIHLEISAHLEKIVGKEIVRNVAYFKIGADNRIYLLWSTMLSFESPHKSFAKNYKLSLSCQERHRNSIYREEVNRSKKAIGLNSQLKCCPVCDQMLPRAQVDFLITHKTIISHSENELKPHIERDAESKVPAIIQKICGPMKIDRFEQLKQKPIFLYQTIQICQTCAHTLNPRQIEVSPKKVAQSRHEEETSAVAPNPPDERSAHFLFWGRVEREAKKKTASEGPKAKPFSAGIPRVRFQRSSLKSTHSSLQYHRYLSQLLPALHGSKTAAQTDSTMQDCIEDFVQHLQRQYHRPSIRFALAQCNIFPSESAVPANVLGWICGADLLLAISNYWTELCKARGDRADASTIDIDALDGILASRAKTRLGVPSDADRSCKNDTTRSGNPSRAASNAELTIAAPVRPSRPRSSSAAVASSRTNSLSSRRVSGSAASQVDTTRASAMEERAVDEHVDAEQRAVVIDGVEYSVDVHACNGIGDGAQYSLHFRATAMEQGKRSTPMDLTLQPNEILALLSGENDPADILSSGKDALIRTILARLHIEDGKLRIAQEPFNGGKRDVAYKDIASTELSAEELLVLEETLMKLS